MIFSDKHIIYTGYDLKISKVCVHENFVFFLPGGILLHDDMCIALDNTSYSDKHLQVYIIAEYKISALFRPKKTSLSK